MRFLERIALLVFAAVAYAAGLRKRDAPAGDKPEDPEPEEEAPKPGALVESLTKLVAFLALACYVAGLVVVNAHLFELGISDFELLRPRFVAVGVLAVGMIAVSTGAVFATAWLLRRVVFAKGTPMGWRLLYLANVAIALSVPWFLFRFPLEQSALNAAWATFASAVLGSLGVLLVVSLEKQDPAKRPKRPGWTPPPAPPWLFAVILLPFLLGYIPLYVGLFANDIYPKVPEQFGGGESRTVQLLVAKDEADAVSELGIEIEPEKRLTEEVELLFQGNTFYVLESPATGEVVKLNDSTVVGVRTGEEAEAN